MFDLAHVIAFAVICMGMALTPGPNMIYLISRAIAQGRPAAFLSLIGVGMGFGLYLLATAAGLTALFLAVPYAYGALKIAGAIYLFYLAWQTVRPGGRSPFETVALAPASRRRLVTMGFLTSFLNPKIAVLYVALLPQFMDASGPGMLGQSLALGGMQIVISLSVNSLIICAASAVAAGLAGRPVWLAVQRWVLGSVLGLFAVGLLRESRR